MIARPVATLDVRSMIGDQGQSTRRAAEMQIDTVQRRLEILHDDDVPVILNGIGTALPPLFRAFQDPTKGRNRAARAIDSSSGASGRAGESRMPAPAFNVWTAGSVFGGDQVYGGQIAKNRGTSTNVTVGIDTVLTDSLKAGVAIGGFSSTTQINLAGARDRTRSLSGTAYASWNAFDRIFVDGLLGIGDVRFATSPYESNAGSMLTARRSGRMAFGSLGVTYEQRYGRLKYAPYARFVFVQARLGAFTEQSAVDPALAFNRLNLSSQIFVLGLRGQYDLAIAGGTISPTVRLEYRHDIAGRAAQVTSPTSFPSMPFDLSVTAPRDVFTSAVGLKVSGKGPLVSSLEYFVTTSKSGMQGQGLRGSMTLRF